MRADLERRGAIFQASSDTEVILHLLAHSSERTLAGSLRDALLQLEGAFSLVFLAQDRVIVARDPHGFRPLAVGEMEISGGRKVYAFASETCAFDLIGAVYLNEVEPGEMIIVGPEGITRERYTPEQPRAQCVFEQVYFSRPDSVVFGRSVEESRREPGPDAGARVSADADLVVPVPDSGVAAAIGYSAESGLPFRQALIRNPLRRPHFYRASQAIPRFWSQVEAQSRAPPAARAARGAGGRFHRARAPRAERLFACCDKPALAKCTTYLLPAHGVTVFLWRGHAHAQRTDRLRPQRGRDPPLRGSRFAGGICRWLRCAKAVADDSMNIAMRATPGTIDGAGQYRGVDRGKTEEAVRDGFKPLREAPTCRRSVGRPCSRTGDRANLRLARAGTGAQESESTEKPGFGAVLGGCEAQRACPPCPLSW